MLASAIRERLNRESFQPFRLRSSRRKVYKINNPDLVVMMKSEIFIAAPNSDRFAQLSYLHIAAIESPRNGHGQRKPRRRRSE